MHSPTRTITHVVIIATIFLLITNAASHSIGQTIHQLVEPQKTSFDSTDVAPLADTTSELASQSDSQNCQDRLWLISTRCLTSDACRADLENPSFAVYRLSHCGRCEVSSIEDYLNTVGPDRPVVVYVHGNRLNSSEAICRALIIYRNVAARHCDNPIDWVVFSWPSAQTGILIRDFREKAERCDAHGLYLAWLLRKHAEASLPTALIGYSFGGRIVTGALHAMAGGSLGHRALPGPAVTGAHFEAGLIAPAIESNWMTPRGYHGRSTENLDRLVLLYNRRDAVLKRYWLLNKVRGAVALGYTGPQAFGPRADGSKLPVRARDCSRFIGLRHDEVDYYNSTCFAGSEMASMIHDVHISQ